MTLDEMTKRAMSQGMSRRDAVQKLQDGFARHGGDNLAYYLHYWGFATEKKAHAIATEYADYLARM